MRVIREILGSKPRGEGTNLSVGLHTLAKVARRRSVAFCISDFFADDYERALSVAAARHDLIPVVLTDPRDEELPNVGLSWFQDLETGEDILVDTGAAEVRKHYQKSMRAHRERHRRLFAKFGLDHCVVHTDRPYIRPLRDLFARRAKRAHR
jgi:uncharacterized protein (DUF58 family)